MIKFVHSVKVIGFSKAIINSKNLFFYFLCLFLSRAELSYSNKYKVNERTRIYTEEISADSVLLKMDNNFTVPVSVKLILNLTNLEGLPASKVIAVIPAVNKGYVVARFKKITAAKSYNCSYNWKIVVGDVDKKPDHTYVYDFPFHKEKNFKISQGPGGLFSHKDMFAYDFIMPVGTPVLAARDGIVAIIKSDSDKGGPDNIFIDDANFISVYHTDGTIANYIHLNKDGVLVKEGQQVKKGDVIAYSGNSGFSSGPHLHFEIIQPAIDNEKNKSIAFNWGGKGDVLISSVKKKFISNLFSGISRHTVHHNAVKEY